MKVLAFRLADGQFGLDIGHIREVMERFTITRVPRSQKTIRGVLNLRGTVIPVVDLRLRMGMAEVETTPTSGVIILELATATETNLLGALVDGVDAVRELDDAMIEPPPVTRLSETGLVSGIARVNEGGHILILDPARILPSPAQENGTPSSRTSRGQPTPGGACHLPPASGSSAPSSPGSESGPPTAAKTAARVIDRKVTTEAPEAEETQPVTAEVPEAEEPRPITTEAPEADVVIGTRTEAEAITEAGTGAEAITEAGTEAVTITEAGTEPETVVEVGTEAEAIIEAGTEAEAITESGIEPEMVVEARAKAQDEMVTASDPPERERPAAPEMVTAAAPPEKEKPAAPESEQEPVPGEGGDVAASPAGGDLEPVILPTITPFSAPPADPVPVPLADPVPAAVVRKKRAPKPLTSPQDQQAVTVSREEMRSAVEALAVDPIIEITVAGLKPPRAGRNRKKTEAGSPALGKAEKRKNPRGKASAGGKGRRKN
ncbi:MAG: chemotaxis protein CheW [Magnetococcales bacterium]|nr:chemotaxis protein CheW [Magnetococcales bacterium]